MCVCYVVCVVCVSTPKVYIYNNQWCDIDRVHLIKLYIILAVDKVDGCGLSDTAAHCVNT